MQPAARNSILTKVAAGAASAWPSRDSVGAAAAGVGCRLSLPLTGDRCCADRHRGLCAVRYRAKEWA